MTPATQDFVAYVGTVFGPYILIFNQTKAALLGTVTVNVGTDKILLTAHGLVTGDQVRFLCTGDYPVPIDPGVYYFVVSPTANDFQIALTSGGSAVNITDNGSGSLALLKRGNPLNLTGYSVKGWAKHVEDWDSSIVIDLAPTITDALNGRVQIQVLDTVTKNWKYGDHMLSIVLNNGTNWLGPYIIGKLTVRGITTDPFSSPPT